MRDDLRVFASRRPPLGRTHASSANSLILKIGSSTFRDVKFPLAEDGAKAQKPRLDGRGFVASVSSADEAPSRRLADDSPSAEFIPSEAQGLGTDFLGHTSEWLANLLA